MSFNMSSDPHSSEESTRLIKDPEPLTTGDILLCVFCSAIGFILGVVRLCRGHGNGFKMMGISLVCSAVWWFIRMVIKEAKLD